MTDSRKSKMCQLSYKVDSSSKEKENIVTGTLREVDGQPYQIIDTEDNQHTGFQAVAVAPVVDGEPDYNQVTVAYAGTNFKDDHDRDTDYVDIAQNITAVLSGGGGFGNNNGAQHQQVVQRMEERHKKYGNVFTDNATGFYERVDKQVKANGGASVCDVTGHSLGGAEALYIASKSYFHLLVKT